MTNKLFYERHKKVYQHYNYTFQSSLPCEEDTYVRTNLSNTQPMVVLQHQVL